MPVGCSVTANVLASVLPHIFVVVIDSRTGDDPDKLAGELGFEPRSSVLETDSLTVELTPPVVRNEANAPHSQIRLEITSFPCGPCVCGRYCRTSRTRGGQWSSFCSSWWSSS